jgi:chemotaxis protein CheD
MMNYHGPQLEKIYLSPGELVIAEEPVMVTTVLGSCISVTMFHPRSGAAAICHAMLPNGGDSNSFKYVDISINHMVKFFKLRNIRKEEIQVKLFGGADMFKNAVANIRNLTVGWQNISVATGCLKNFGLTPSVTDTGGNKGRKLIFKTNSGAVFIKKLSSQDQVVYIND